MDKCASCGVEKERGQWYATIPTDGVKEAWCSLKCLETING